MLLKLRRIIPITMLIAMLALLFACENPSAETFEGNAKSIMVVVSEKSSKAITPSGETDITHYRIRVENKAEEYVRESGYLSAGSSFNVTNVPAGMWTATVDAYVKNGTAGTDDDYIHVATATSAETRVDAEETAVLTVTLDTLLDTLSGDITVTLDMPAELDDESDTFYYTYTIAGTGQRSDYSYVMDTPTQGTVDASGNGTLVIDADAIDPQLNQGAYLLTVTVFDEATEETSNVVRKGVEIMRLLPGLAASGTINLNAGEAIDEEGIKISVVDKIGDFLNLGQVSYDSFAEDMTITVDYSSVSTDTPVDVYVDGVKKTATADYTATPSGTSVAFTFTSMDSGRHVVTFILNESDTELGVGALSVEVNIPIEGDIEEPSHFSYTVNPDGTSCTINGENPDYPLPSHEGLTIPSEIDGYAVTAIGSHAFSDDSFTGSLVIPNSVTTIGRFAFSRNSFDGSLTLGKNLQTIGESAFYDNSFTGDLVIPDSVTTIGVEAFYDNSFTGDLVIPDSVTTIGDEAFARTSFDGTLTLGKSLQTIGAAAFRDNSFTGDLVIPDSVTTIGDEAFARTSFDGTLTLGKNLQTIGNYAFYDSSFTGSLVIPGSVIEIGENLFGGSEFKAIYYENTDQPSGWHENWDKKASDYKHIVFWGISESEYQELIKGETKPVISAVLSSVDNTAVITIEGYKITNLGPSNFMVKPTVAPAEEYSPTSSAIDNGDGTYTITRPPAMEGSNEVYLTGAGHLLDSDPITMYQRQTP